MTRQFSGQTFERFRDRNGTASCENVSFADCTFFDCLIGSTDDVSRRSMFRNVCIQNCKAIGCSIGPAVLEDSVIDGLSTDFVLAIFGALFKRVRLKGKIGEFRINTGYTLVGNKLIEARFDEDRRKYYENVDWALDISEGKFVTIEICGIPSRLIRRDADTQVVVTRERAVAIDWASHIQSDHYVALLLRSFVTDGEPDMVIAAPKGARKKKFLEQLEDINRLRDIGVAEPD